MHPSVLPISDMPLPTYPLTARAVTTIAHGVVVALHTDGYRGSQGILSECESAALGLIDSFKPLELSNLVWAFSKVNHRATKLFDLVAQRAIALLERGTDDANKLFEKISAESAKATTEEQSAGVVVGIGQPGTSASADAFLASYNLDDGAAPSRNPERDRAYEDEDDVDELGEERADSAVGALLEFERLDAFTSQEATNILFAYARVAHPCPDLFAAAAAPVRDAYLSGFGVLHGWSLQDMTSTLWAHAAADCVQEELVVACTNCLSSRAYHFPLTDRKLLTMIWQWVIWWELEMGREVGDWMDAALRKRCREAIASGDVAAGGHTTSQLQRRVCRCLDRLGVAYVEEHIIEEGYSIDMCIPSKGVCIEVDGPYHFCQDLTLNGPTRLKQRQLQNLGWKLVSVPHFEWQPLRRDPAQENAYLTEKLKEVGFAPGAGPALSTGASEATTGNGGLPGQVAEPRPGPSMPSPSLPAQAPELCQGSSMPLPAQAPFAAGMQAAQLGSSSTGTTSPPRDPRLRYVGYLQR